MISLHFFDLGRNFLDPPVSKNGEPYGPKRFKEIVKECWYISDNIHTSYNEVLQLSFQERAYLIECINTKLEQTKKTIEEMQQNRK